MMRKFFFGLSTLATFLGMVWGIFYHPFVLLAVAGLAGSWLSANWEN